MAKKTVDNCGGKRLVKIDKFTVDKPVKKAEKKKNGK